MAGESDGTTSLVEELGALLDKEIGMPISGLQGPAHAGVQESQEEPISSGQEFQEKPVSSMQESQEKPVSSTQESKEKPTSSTQESREKPTSNSLEPQQEKPISSAQESKEKPISSAQESKEKPISSAQESKEKPISSAQESKEKPISSALESQEKPPEVQNQETVEAAKRLVAAVSSMAPAGPEQQALLRPGTVDFDLLVQALLKAQAPVSAQNAIRSEAPVKPEPTESLASTNPPAAQALEKSANDIPSHTPPALGATAEPANPKATNPKELSSEDIEDAEKQIQDLVCLT